MMIIKWSLIFLHLCKGFYGTSFWQISLLLFTSFSFILHLNATIQILNFVLVSWSWPWYKFLSKCWCLIWFLFSLINSLFDKLFQSWSFCWTRVFLYLFLNDALISLIILLIIFVILFLLKLLVFALIFL